MRLKVQFEDASPSLLGWPRTLNLAFLTVIQNGVEAMDGSGEVTIWVGPRDGGAVVEVRDQGRGMTPEQVTGLFDLAWSSEGSRQKMRLGLVAAQVTVHEHGGRLTVDSEAGKGTCVTFWFPSAEASRISSDQAKPLPSGPPQSRSH